MKFHVLVVCSANVCRSPLVAIQLAQQLELAGTGGRVQVTSAGVRAVEGQAACLEMASVAASHGLCADRLAAHRARQLTRDQAAVADLILTSDRQVRSSLLKLVPPAAPHTFTVREAAALSERVAPRQQHGSAEDRLWSWVESLHAGRGLVELPRTRHLLAMPLTWRPLPVHDHDIPDAHQHDLAPHRLVHRISADSTRQLARCLVACTATGVR